MTDPTGNALLARIKELEEALEPFADAAENTDMWPDDFYISDSDVVGSSLRFIDIRNARKVLNK